MKDFWKKELQKTGLKSREEIAEESLQEQYKCPNCSSFDTFKDSQKFYMQMAGAGLIFLAGIGMLFFWPILLLTPIGIVILIASLFIKETNEMKCQRCKFEFKKEDAQQ